MLKKTKFWIFAIFLALVISGWFLRGNFYNWYHGGNFNSQECRYNEKCKVLKQDRDKLQRDFQRNPSSSIKKASKLFTRAMYEQLFQCWYGTSWSYSGTTETPQEGSIACGYFVTTLLRDAGVPIKRVKLAQCSSAEMIQSLVDPAYIYNYNRLNMSEFRSAILKKGEHLYIIGLDNHTGFIACIDKEVYFIHSSGVSPFCVVKEKIMDSGILKKSSWKLCGAISKDHKFLERWIKN